MALTRPRAYQIYDIDYKQATRVITLTNIVLTAGAPNSVDGVNLSLNDRILVAGQSNAVQNGIYYVTTLGSGANGTWSRSIDTDTTGELLAGTIVMVTEGLIYADTQWKLTTNDPIVIGTTALTFEQNSAFAFGNVYANGTAVLATSVGDVVTFSAGNNISITGNNSSKTVTIGVTGISLNSISNGTSNVNVVSSGGNVTVGVGGTSNVAVFATSGVFVTGVVSATGNITGANLNTSGLVSATGNLVGGNITTAGLITATGNITSTANVTGGNITTAGLITATGNITSTANVTGGNITTAGLITATGNITSTANVTGGNITTAGLITATGNITSSANISGGNILGNGRNLTGINTFSTISVSGQSDVVADAINDTLTLAAGTGIALTTSDTTDTITISQVSTTSIFATGGDMGTITEAVTVSEDLGNVTTSATVSYDLGTETTSGILTPSYLLLPSKTVTQLASLTASPAGQFVYCSDESGGAVPAFSDGTNWRRVTDRAIVS
jgi:hypothetical protein